MERLTEAQAVIVSGYTGYLCCNFAALHEDINRRMGRPVFTHEMADDLMRKAVQSAYRADFLAICAEGTAQ